MQYLLLSLYCSLARTLVARADWEEQVVNNERHYEANGKTDVTDVWVGLDVRAGVPSLVREVVHRDGNADYERQWASEVLTAHEEQVLH